MIENDQIWRMKTGVILFNLFFWWRINQNGHTRKHPFFKCKIISEIITFIFES